ncbi:PaaI family thioesterase [Luteibacter aegosomatissinici]|uniref:PaaI family thioesterase n=1 Tax=Luteibacter aegosomatissinici TaxID=2911539 RepID=UPI001FF9BDB7|nr:PaaI family thioesterase [Luteibacter aegosomatissinici]UPG92448.1 PaaI family thioesterase [Luteibacter aegosomatissinici]
MNIVGQLPPGLTGLEQLQKLIEMGGRPPIGETMDITLVDAGDGYAVFEGMPSLRVYNPIGMVHGGFAATLLDSACGCAVHSKLSPTQAYTTLELKTAYHKAITGDTGLMRAEGRVLSIGRRVAFTEATLKDAAGKLYASATSTLLVMER